MMFAKLGNIKAAGLDQQAVVSEVDPLIATPVVPAEPTVDPDVVPPVIDPDTGDVIVSPTPDLTPAADGEEDPMMEDVVIEPIVPGDEVVEDDLVSPDDASDDERELDVFDTDGDELGELENEMRMLADSAIAIESFGINPTALAILQTTRLLSGTALESLGLESFQAAKPSDDESQMALEAIGAKIKEKAAAWSAKVLHVAKAGSEKVLSILSSLFGKLMDASKFVAGKAWSATKATGRTIKAHPFATAAAVVTAIAAVGGIVMFAGGNLPAFGVKGPAWEAFLERVKEMGNKIKWPFGKPDFSVVGGKLKGGFAAAKGVFSAGATEGTAAKLGWTQTSSKVITGQLTRAWNLVETGLVAVGARGQKVVNAALNSGAGKAMTSAKDVVYRGFVRPAYDASNVAFHEIRHVTGSESTGAVVGALTFGAYMSGIVTLLSSLILFTRNIVIGGFKLLLHTFGLLKAEVEATPAAA